jgi:lysophospholipase L1-like esterase
MRDPKLIWRLRPGAEGTRGGYPVKINAHGLRGPTVPYAKPDDEFRVLFVGDSTTLGYGLAWESTFVAQTQARLPRLDSRSVTVINAGIDGYTTWQELGWLGDEGLRYAPNVVVLGFCPNDLTDYEWPFIVYAGGRWLRHSGMFRALQRWRHGPSGIWVQGRRRDFVPPLIVDMFAADESESVRRGWSEALEGIGKMSAECRERGIAFVLLYIPTQAQVVDPGRFDSRPQRKLAAFAVERGIPFLDPLPAMLSLGPKGADGCYLDNWHLSAAGHALVASLVADWLRFGVSSD